MKILAVQETDWLGSLPIQSHQIMESLSRRGHEVRVVDFEARWKPQEILSSMRCRVFSHATRTDPKSSVCLIRPGMVKALGLGRASSFLTQLKVIFQQMASWSDVVVLYSVPTNGFQTVLSSRLLAKPILFHSFDVLHEMTGYSFLRPPTWTLERFVYPRMDKIVVISLALKNYMRNMRIREEKIVLIPPAVNADRFSPQVSGEKFREELHIRSGSKVVLFSGWLYSFCGVDMVMESMQEIVSRVPDARLVICGDGPLLAKLFRMREQLALQEYVRIVGRRPFDQMPEIVASADICINPYLPCTASDFAFPSKIAEYMASGKAVIATDLPGTRSLLDDSSGVSIVPPTGVTERLLALLLDDDTRAKKGEISRKYCEEKFSLHSVTDRFESLLVGLAGG